MRRGTTPMYTLGIDGYDLSGMTVYVTVKQGTVVLELTGGDLSIVTDETGSTIVFALTQEQTLGFAEGAASVQVRFIDADGAAYATEIGRIYVSPILKDGVIEYDG